jgi:hypothetical protein
MPSDSGHSSVSRRQFLATTSALVAVSLVPTRAAGQPPPSVAYAVTIDFTQYPPKYSFACTPANGAKCASPNGNAYRLTVPQGSSDSNSVAFTVITPGAQHSAAIAFTQDTPFVDINRRPVYVFAWSDREESSGQNVLHIASDAAAQEYEYRIVATDNTNKKTYSDDPKIIVGSGSSLNELLNVRARLELEEKRSPQDKEKFERLIRELDNVIQTIEQLGH